MNHFIFIYKSISYVLTLKEKACGGINTIAVIMEKLLKEREGAVIFESIVSPTLSETEYQF